MYGGVGVVAVGTAGLLAVPPIAVYVVRNGCAYLEDVVAHVIIAVLVHVAGGDAEVEGGHSGDGPAVELFRDALVGQGEGERHSRPFGEVHLIPVVVPGRAVVPRDLDAVADGHRAQVLNLRLRIIIGFDLADLDSHEHPVRARAVLVNTVARNLEGARINERVLVIAVDAATDLVVVAVVVLVVTRCEVPSDRVGGRDPISAADVDVELIDEVDALGDLPVRIDGVGALKGAGHRRNRRIREVHVQNVERVVVPHAEEPYIIDILLAAVRRECDGHVHDPLVPQAESVKVTVSGIPAVKAGRVEGAIEAHDLPGGKGTDQSAPGGRRQPRRAVPVVRLIVGLIEHGVAHRGESPEVQLLNVGHGERFADALGLKGLDGKVGRTKLKRPLHLGVRTG